MSVGSYGTKRPSDISPADVDIIYYYAADRLSSSPATLSKLDATTLLTPVYHNSDTGGTPDVEVLSLIHI